MSVTDEEIEAYTRKLEKKLEEDDLDFTVYVKGGDDLLSERWDYGYRMFGCALTIALLAWGAYESYPKPDPFDFRVCLLYIGIVTVIGLHSRAEWVKLTRKIEEKRKKLRHEQSRED